MVDTLWDSEFVGLCFALGRACGVNAVGTIRVFFMKWEEGQSHLVLCLSQVTCLLGELGKVIFFSLSLWFQIWGVGLIIDHKGYLRP